MDKINLESKVSKEPYEKWLTKYAVSLKPNFEDIDEKILKHCKSVCCCFTGHRKIYLDRIELQKNIELQIIQALKENFSNFMCGGALGFDTIAAHTILNFKKNIRI